MCRYFEVLTILYLLIPISSFIFGMESKETKISDCKQISENHNTTEVLNSLNNYLQTLSKEYSFKIHEMITLYYHVANVESKIKCIIKKYQFVLERNWRNPLSEVQKTIAAIETSRLEAFTNSQHRSQIKNMEFQFTSTIEVKNNKIVELENTTKETENEIRILQKNNLTFSQRVEELQTNITSCQTKTAALEEEVKQKLADNNNLKCTNEKCNGSLDKRQLEISHITEQLTICNQLLDKHQLEINEIQGKLTICNQQKDSQPKKLAECERKIRSWQTSYRYIKSHLQDCENMLNNKARPKQDT